MSDELNDERIADLFARAKSLSAEDQTRFLDEEWSELWLNGGCGS
jgi:hypothetical protein